MINSINIYLSDACPQDNSLEITATTNAPWEGAPPPLFCGPKGKYNGLGYWNPMKNCPDKNCVAQPFYYEGQLAGVHVPISEDERFPAFFYTNPLSDANGNKPPPRSPEAFPNTNVEGCCWWGRGVIQTTGRCNFGKLNKNLGAGAGSNALFPNINFCKNPQAICDGPPELKWIAGIFFWVTEVEKYNQDGFKYKEGVKDFVKNGCMDDLEMDGCDNLFKYASGIVNRGCHDPGETGCPGCVPGSTCDPAHNIPERIKASNMALCTLMKAFGSITDCSVYSHAGGGSPVPGPTPAVPTPAVPTPATTTNYCGRSWSDASSKCGQQCPNAQNSECPSGEACFGGITDCGGK